MVNHVPYKKNLYGVDLIFTGSAVRYKKILYRAKKDF